MLREEGQCTLPRQRCGCRLVGRVGVAVEGVVGIGIDKDLRLRLFLPVQVDGAGGIAASSAPK